MTKTVVFECPHCEKSYQVQSDRLGQENLLTFRCSSCTKLFRLNRGELGIPRERKTPLKWLPKGQRWWWAVGAVGTISLAIASPLFTKQPSSLPATEKKESLPPPPPKFPFEQRSETPLALGTVKKKEAPLVKDAKEDSLQEQDAPVTTDVSDELPSKTLLGDSGDKPVEQKSAKSLSEKNQTTKKTSEKIKQQVPTSLQIEFLDAGPKGITVTLQGIPTEGIDTFQLLNPHRYVIDLPKVEWHGKFNLTPPNTSVLQKVRIGQKSKTTRIVLDLDKKATVSLKKDTGLTLRAELP